MKKYLIVFVSILALTFTATASAQEKQSAQATFNGFDGDAYTFATVSKSVEDSKLLSFKDVSTDILAQFDLKSEAFKGESFTVIYTVTMESLESPDGTEQEVETYTLVSIKK